MAKDKVDDFLDWCKENELDPEDLILWYERWIRDKYKQRDVDQYLSHKHLVGKCYQHEGRYYKIISIKANNPSRISFMSFPEHPSYSFKHPISKSFRHCEYEGEFNLNGIFVGDTLVGTKHNTAFGITNFKEISELEFSMAYENFCNELYEMDWEED